MELSRHTLREKAMQALFSMEFNDTLDSTSAIEFALQYDDEQRELPNDSSYVYTLVNGVQAHKAKIDQLVEKHLKNWTINRLPRLDLTIMRIAIYEMLIEEEIPAVAAIDEAIQIVKEYGNDKSRRFINAVLANVHSDLTEA